MIGFITIHYKDKSEFEQFVLEEKMFTSKLIKKDLNSENFTYPLEAKYQSMSYKIDEYKGYLFGNIRLFYSEEKAVKYTNAFGYSNLCESIDLLSIHTTQIESTTISRISIVFNVFMPISGDYMIKNNIIMHKLLGYNHNLSEDLKKGVKIFEYHNYKFCFSSAMKKRKVNKDLLTVRLDFKTSAELRKIGLYNIKDLKIKSKLEGLFNIFLHRLNELTIIDSIENWDVFSEIDRQQLITYMDPRFWDNLLIRSKRNTKYRAKKDFERMQKVYKLNTLQNLLREKIIIEFDSFINN